MILSFTILPCHHPLRHQESFKVNTDAACPKSRDNVLLAAIAHNEAGVKIRAVTVQLDVIPVLTTEIIAILSGLKLVKQLTITHLFLESDSTVAMDYINSPRDRWPWSLQVLLLDIQDISKCFQLCTITFVKRDANYCAHEMAQLGLRLLRRGSGGICWSLLGTSSLLSS